MLRRLLIGLGVSLLACGGRTGSDLPGSGAASGSAGTPGTGGSAGKGGVSGSGNFGATSGSGNFGGGGVSGSGNFGAIGGGGVSGSGNFGAIGGGVVGGGVGYGGYPSAGGAYPTGGSPGTGGIGSYCYYNGGYYPPGSYVNPCCFCEGYGVIACTGDCGAGGSAGGGSMCAPPPPDFFAPVIDDFEDGDYVPNHPLGIGNWYSFSDSTGRMSWALSKPGLDGSVYALTLSGSGNVSWGAGMGVALRGLSNACPYPAERYNGIGFTLRSNAIPIRVSVLTRATVPVEEGGTCTAGELCYDHYGTTISGYTGGYALDFGSMTQEGWGVLVPFDRSQVMGIQFHVPVYEIYDVTIDNLRFYSYLE